MNAIGDKVLGTGLILLGGAVAAFGYDALLPYLSAANPEKLQALQHLARTVTLGGGIVTGTYGFYKAAVYERE